MSYIAPASSMSTWVRFIERPFRKTTRKDMKRMLRPAVRLCASATRPIRQGIIAPPVTAVKSMPDTTL